MSEEPEDDPLAAVPINIIGDKIVTMISDGIGRPVSIVMFVIDDETGKLISTTNLAMEQIGEFLDFARAAHRTGSFTVDKMESRH